MTLVVLTGLKHRPTGGAITAAALRLSPYSDDDSAFFFELAVRDPDGVATNSGSEREFSLSTSRGGSLRSNLSYPSDDLVTTKPGIKLRVLMARLQKTTSGVASAKRQQQQSSFFNLKPEEAVPIALLFTRTSGGRAASPEPEERRPSRDSIQRYLSKIKPLYVRVLKKYDRQLISLKPDGSPAPASHRGGLSAGLKGMNRSVPAAVRSLPTALPRQRDDSLLDQKGGIQSAIAHCKRSFNAGRGEGSRSVTACCFYY